MSGPGDAHLRDLRYFLAVADELSFTRAAEALFVSQPALSKQVRGLEARLGTELFARGHRSIALTDAGRALLPRAERIVAEWDGAVAELRAVTDTARHTVVVGFHTRIGRGLVPAISAALEERLPGWRLQFRQVPWGDPSVGLNDGTVDVAVGWLPVPGQGIAHRVAATEPRWVALPVGHPLLAHRRACRSRSWPPSRSSRCPTRPGRCASSGWPSDTADDPGLGSGPRRPPRTRRSRRWRPGSASRCSPPATPRSTAATTWCAGRCPDLPPVRAGGAVAPR